MTKHLWGRCSPIILLMLTHILTANGQAAFDTKPDIVTPPSPVAASLLQNVSVPVNYYTGTPEINLPLQVIRTGSLQMPIAIRYNASGIKVEQDAGLIGLGWDVQTGGVIGRSIVGTPDEATLNTAGGAGYRASATFLQMPLPAASDLATTGWLSGLSSCYLKQLAVGTPYDLSPDNYFMSFNGNSAKLFFDKNAKPYFSPYKVWKLTGNEATGFVVKTEDGTTYEFKLPESSTDNYETLPTDLQRQIQANTSWYLTQVISANKADTIRLNYVNILYHPVSYNPSQSHSVLVKGQIGQPCAGQAEPEINSTTTAEHSINGYLLQSIITRDERVVFYTNANRLDIPDGSKGLPYKLDSIVDYAVLPGGQNSVIKRYVFDYDYYNGGGTTLEKRLRLVALRQLGASNEYGEEYHFSYNESTALPARDSKAQDSWGYFNGKSNTTLIPTFVDAQGFEWPGADRSTNAAGAIAGLLTNIQYPTGGTTTYEYEANQYATNPTIPDSTLVEDSRFASASGTSTSATNTVSVPFRQNVRIYWNVDELTQHVGEVLVGVTNSAGQSVFARQTIGSATENLWLDAGVYTLSVQKDPIESQSGIIRVYWKYKAPLPAGTGLLAGGARIRRIVQSDGRTKTIKRFSYLSDNSLSSGKILSMPIYGDYRYTPMYCSFVKVDDWQYYTQHTVPTVELGRVQGNYICYTKITVYNGDNGENGRQEYYYNFVSDGGGTGFPYSQQTSMDDFRGQLLRQDTYNSNGQLLLRAENQYNLSTQPGYPNYVQLLGVKVGFNRVTNTLNSAGCPDLLNNQWICRAKTYAVNQLWPTLANTKRIVFNPGTNESVTTETSMSYDPINLQMAQQSVRNSKADLVTDYYKYPKDFAGTAVYDTLIARNIINPIIENDHYYNSTLEAKSLIPYQLWPTGMALPAGKQLQYLNNPLETRLQYLSYDNGGNLLTQRKVNDVPVSYIWDYWNHRPIAEVVNALPADISYTSFEFDGTGNFSVGSLMRNTTQAKVGAASYNLSNGAITKSGLDNTRTYVVSYWSSAGSATVNGTAGTQLLSKNGWNYYEHKLSGITAITINGAITLDELKLYPANALMTSYTYKPLVGVASVCTPDNRITYYEYDGLSRLLRQRDMDGNIVKQFEYQYSSFYNDPQSGNFIRSNCGSNATGSTVTYTIGAGLYRSTFSKADANQKAQDAVNAGGAAYANANGACTFYNQQQSRPFIKGCACQYSGSTVTYTVPAYTYSSLISLDDANGKAISNINLNGQNNANALGTCTTTCNPPSRKILNCNCLQGTINVDMKQVGSRCQMNYYWSFSDGTTQPDHTVLVPGTCQW